MHILQVHLQVKPERVEAFRQATLENARASRQEPGVVRFDVLQQVDEPTRFVFTEVYRNAEGQAQHRETAHYKRWAEAVTDMLAQPRTRAVYTNVDPSDQDW